MSQTVAFQTIDGDTKLVGIEGTSEENPIIVLRTGFVLSLVVENQDDFPHMLMIKGLDVVTNDLAPGERDHIMIFTYDTGEYDLVDVATNQNVGKLKIVKLQEDFPLTSQVSEIPISQIPEISIIPTLPQGQPGRIQTTLAFEEIDGNVQIVGIQGVSGINPTLVTRTGYLYDLIIINKDSNTHSLFLEEFNLSSGSIPPGQTAMITVYPTEEGNYGYYDETMIKPLGNLMVVKVEPSVPKISTTPAFSDIPTFEIAKAEPGRIKSTLQIETINGELSLIGVMEFWELTQH